MKADALMQEAAVKLKSGFTWQMTENKNSSGDNLMINVWARENVVDRWLLQPTLLTHH